MPVLEHASNTTAHNCTFTDIRRDQINYINYITNHVHHHRERLIIADWLSPLNFKMTQNDVFNKRTKGTGQWLLKSHEFHNWLTGESKELWCPGMPGSGKTILASIVIDYLQTTFNDAVVVCIYCNYKEQAEQTVSGFIASLLKQVIQDRPMTSDNIKSLYERHIVRGTRPTHDEFRRAFKSEVGTSRVYIVVDALDEFSERDQGYLIRELQSLGSTIYLMVTSRPLSLIGQHFQDAIRIDIRAHDDDIRKYIEDRIMHENRLVLHIHADQALQECIIEKTTTNVRGMFLLVKLHLDLLATKSDRRAVRDALDKLPTEVKATYDITMERIAKQDDSDRKLAYRILSWVTCAYRPLFLEELQNAVALSPSMSVMDPEAIVPEQILTSVCAGLIVIDKPSNIVRLVHYTAQEYFESNRQKYFSNAQIDITNTCLTYLSFEVFQSGYCLDITELNSFLRENALLDYAASHWGRHARGGIGTCVETEMVQEFLRKPANVACARQILTYRRYSRFNTRFPEDPYPLHLLSYFGLEKVVQLQLQNGAPADLKDMYGRSPLSIASENGHSRVVELLLEQVYVDVNSMDSDRRTPLLYAAKNGHDTVVGLLLARQSVKINLSDADSRTPLSLAAQNGYDKVVKTLLARHDVEVNSMDSHGRTPLSYAAGYGYDIVVRTLLAQPDIKVNIEGSGKRTPLLFAAKYGHDAVVWLLLAQGDVDVNSRHSKYGRTPLSYAAGNGHDAVVKMLLMQHNIQINTMDSHSRTPLSYAAANGHDAVVKILLTRHDIKVNSKGRWGMTPLSLAAKNGHDRVVWLLLARAGVEVNSVDLVWRTALSYATEKGRDVVVELLLARHDIKVHSKDLWGRTPLLLAVNNGHDTVVRLLLTRKNIDVNLRARYGQVPPWYTRRK